MSNWIFSLVIGFALSASKHKVFYPNEVGHKNVKGTISQVGVVKKRNYQKAKINARKAQKKFKKKNLKVKNN